MDDGKTESRPSTIDDRPSIKPDDGPWTMDDGKTESRPSTIDNRPAIKPDDGPWTMDDGKTPPSSGLLSHSLAALHYAQGKRSRKSAPGQVRPPSPSVPSLRNRAGSKANRSCALREAGAGEGRDEGEAERKWGLFRRRIGLPIVHHPWSTVGFSKMAESRSSTVHCPWAIRSQ